MVSLGHGRRDALRSLWALQRRGLQVSEADLGVGGLRRLRSGGFGAFVAGRGPAASRQLPRDTGCLLLHKETHCSAEWLHYKFLEGSPPCNQGHPASKAPRSEIHPEQTTLSQEYCRMTLTHVLGIRVAL